MPKVKNSSWSPRLLAVGGRRIAMPARGIAEITNDEAGSPEVQSQIADGSLIVLPETAAESSRGRGKTGDPTAVATPQS
jgi:hypothetical protein